MLKEAVATTASISLLSWLSDEWRVYQFEAAGKPALIDVSSVLEALAASAEQDDRPICVLLSGLSTPNSRVLAALVGLLTTVSGRERRVALAGAGKGWLDMLDILGVGHRFVVLAADDVPVPEE